MPEVYGTYTTPANSRISALVSFPTFQEIHLGCCTERSRKLLPALALRPPRRSNRASVNLQDYAGFSAAKPTGRLPLSVARRGMGLRVPCAIAGAPRGVRYSYGASFGSSVPGEYQHLPLPRQMYVRGIPPRGSNRPRISGHRRSQLPFKDPRVQPPRGGFRASSPNAASVRLRHQDSYQGS